MKNTASGYIVAFDRSSLNLKILRHVLEKRHIKTFGTNNLFLLLNYIKELKIDALLVTLHHNDKPAKASANVKEGDIITISFGNKEVKVEVLDVQETVKKEEAKELFRYV